MTLLKSIFYGFLVFANAVFFLINSWEAYFVYYQNSNRLAIFGAVLTFVHLCVFIPLWIKARDKEAHAIVEHVGL